MSVLGANGAEISGISCGVPKTGEKVEGRKAEGRFVAEDGDEKSISQSRGHNRSITDCTGVRQ